MSSTKDTAVTPQDPTAERQATTASVAKTITEIGSADCYCLGFTTIDNYLIVFAHYEGSERTEATTYSVTIHKVDEDGNYLSGAQLRIRDLSGSAVKKFESTGDSITLSGLEAGTYTLVETEAPEGYDVAEDITFTISSDGTLYQDAEEVEYLTMVNEASSSSGSSVKAYSVQIRKWDPENSTYVSGCELIIYDDAGEQVTVYGNSTGTSTLDNPWTTGLNYTEVFLPDGTYTLHENSAADEYDTASDVTFIVRKGKLIQNGSYVSYVMMADYKIGTVNIYKYITDTSTPLAGATLVITDEEGNAVSTYTTTGEDGEVWAVSGVSDYVIYTLTETETPDGYATAEPITFQVSGGALSILTTDEDGEESYEAADAIIMYNTPNLCGIGFACVVSGDEDTYISGISLSISGAASSSWESASETTWIDDLPAGDYTVTITDVPTGHETTSSFDFTVEMDSTGAFTVTTDNTTVSFVEAADGQRVGYFLIPCTVACEVTFEIGDVTSHYENSNQDNTWEEGDYITATLSTYGSGDGREDQVGTVKITGRTGGIENSGPISETISEGVQGFSIDWSYSIAYARTVYLSVVSYTLSETDGNTASAEDSTGWSTSPVTSSCVVNTACTSLNVVIQFYVEFPDDSTTRD